MNPPLGANVRRQEDMHLGLAIWKCISPGNPAIKAAATTITTTSIVHESTIAAAKPKTETARQTTIQPNASCVT
ncbi:unnamed protein product, partial [Ceratitis capitata]